VSFPTDRSALLSSESAPRAMSSINDQEVSRELDSFWNLRLLEFRSYQVEAAGTSSRQRRSSPK